MQIKFDSNQSALLPSSSIAKALPKKQANKPIPIKSILFHKYSFSEKLENLKTITPSIKENGALIMNIKRHPNSSLIHPPM